jgi:hypothetical protein
MIIILAKKKFKLLWIVSTLCMFYAILLFLTKKLPAIIHVIIFFQIVITNVICLIILSQALQGIIAKTNPEKM